MRLLPRPGGWFTAALGGLVGGFAVAAVGWADAPAAVEQTRPGETAAVAAETVETAALERDVAWLAAPEREGRGPGTAGIEAAAEWLAERFAALGLEVPEQRASVWQPFEMTLEAKLGAADGNRAELLGPPAPDGSRELIRLTLGEDFTPLAIGGSGPFDLPLAFVGYGITAPAEHYDDYAALEQILGSGLVDGERQQIRHQLFDSGRRDDLIRALLQSSPELATSTQAVISEEEEVDDQDDQDEVEAPSNGAEAT